MVDPYENAGYYEGVENGFLQRGARMFATSKQVAEHFSVHPATVSDWASILRPTICANGTGEIHHWSESNVLALAAGRTLSKYGCTWREAGDALELIRATAPAELDDEIEQRPTVLGGTKRWPRQSPPG